MYLDEFDPVAMDLIHVLELTAAESGSLLQVNAARQNLVRIVPYMEGQVPGACIREGYRNAGPDFIPPPKHRKPALGTRLT